jgi:hypothetical protein
MVSGDHYVMNVGFKAAIVGAVIALLGAVATTTRT